MKRVENLKPGDTVILSSGPFKVKSNFGTLVIERSGETFTLGYDEVRRRGVRYMPPKIGNTRAASEVVV